MRNLTYLAALSARLVEVRAVRCRVISFAPLPPLLGVTLLMASMSIGVGCAWAVAIAREIATTSALKSVHFFRVSTRINR